MGLLAARGDTPIPGEAGVALAIFVLPLNSALNPFLYTINAVMVKQAQKKHALMMKQLESKIRAQILSGIPMIFNIVLLSTFSCELSKNKKKMSCYAFFLYFVSIYFKTVLLILIGE